MEMTDGELVRDEAKERMRTNILRLIEKEIYTNIMAQEYEDFLQELITKIENLKA